MSLKENISMVKEELNSEEKFFEKAVITERFVKKYKNIMIASVVAIVVIVTANIAYTMNEDSKKTAANIALVTLGQNPKDSFALGELSTLNPSLYDAWMFSQAVANKDLESLKKLQNSKAQMVGDLASYELANDAQALNEYSAKQDAVFKDLALVQSAVMLLNQNKIEEARTKLLKVPAQSSLTKVVQALLHYGVK